MDWPQRLGAVEAVVAQLEAQIAVLLAQREAADLKGPSGLAPKLLEFWYGALGRLKTEVSRTIFLDGIVRWLTGLG